MNTRRAIRSAALAPAAIALALAVPPGLSETSRAGETSAAAVSRLATLSGEWQGTYEWTGGRSDRGAMNARYFTTGNGSAVLETLTVDGLQMMTTVYHADGPDLRMTHYCS